MLNKSGFNMSNPNWSIPFDLKTIVSTLMVAAIIALLSNMWSLNESQNETSSTLKVMSEVLQRLEKGTGDRWTATDAKETTFQINKRIDEKVKDLSSRISLRNSEMKEADNKLSQRMTVMVDVLSKRIEELEHVNNDLSQKIFIMQDRLIDGRNIKRSELRPKPSKPSKFDEYDPF